MRHGPRLSDVMTATLRPLAAFVLLVCRLSIADI
jgi:hypothetical protein